MKKISEIKFLVYTTVFGVLWGVFEMFIGTYLHLLNVPLRGAFMAGAGSVILCVSRFYVDKPGATLAMGMVAAAVKMLSFGAFKLGPVGGIIIESLIVEIVLTVFRLNLFSVFSACLLACLEGVPHFFATNWIIYGGDIFGAYLDVLKKISAIFGIKTEFYWKIIFLWVSAHLLIGSLAGLAALSMMRKLKNER